MLRYVIVASVFVASYAHAQDCAVDGFAPGPKLVADDLLAQWNSEVVTPESGFGADASFDLDATELHVTFGAPASLGSAANVTSLVGDGSAWTIADAVVVGVGSGRVDITGTSFTTSGASVSGAVSSVDTTVLGVDLAAVDVSHAVITGYTSATLTDVNGIATDLGASFTLSAGTVTGGSARVVVDSASITSGQVAIAGDFGPGASITVDGSAVTPVRSVVGNASTFVIDATGITGTARATQVFDDAGPKLPSAIEVVALSPLVAVSSGGSANVPMAVRNTSSEAVAILQEIDVDGCASTAVTPVVDTTLPDMVTILVNVIQESGWAAPFVAIAVAPILGVAIVVDAFADVADAFTSAIGDIFCGIFGCDDSSAPPPPVPPVPFPKWIEPGAVQYFEVALLPNLGDGDYPVRVRFLGQNYAEVHADFTLRVGQGAVPGGWQCDLASFGGGDGCDCGCGAVDADCNGACDVDHCGSDAHLSSDNASCVYDPPPPASDPGTDPNTDDSSHDDPIRFDCSSVPLVEVGGWSALVVLAAFLRRRRR